MAVFAENAFVNPFPPPCLAFCFKNLRNKIKTSLVHIREYYQDSDEYVVSHLSPRGDIYKRAYIVKSSCLRNFEQFKDDYPTIVANFYRKYDIFNLNVDPPTEIIREKE